MVERVCIYPCGGIKRVESSVARIAAYIVNEDFLPKKTLILCVPAFLRGVEEDLVMVEDYPSVIIDCSDDNCATNLFYMAGLKPAARIFIPEIAEANSIKMSAQRRELDDQGSELASAVARETARVASAMLENPNYEFPKQNIKTNTCLANASIIPENPFQYKKIAPGIYIPAEMPEFFPEGA
ncbi:putative zinc-binding protein [Candidatus Contubernalis alkaliaceticus]|uniref:putative zinc-binding protein n=1 Tax=Candidatus Contubernalis alkaliaceticus TaxID=338645 RepID=UPI001F4BF15A|nr:putative zinc-binding protein [Candidatus Contubernalis alkalaceticus]UNC91577.1 hypothetical protein HUE98_05435 [Candidatus Contubernalis alkalaceticus]